MKHIKLFEELGKSSRSQISSWNYPTGGHKLSDREESKLIGLGINPFDFEIKTDGPNYFCIEDGHIHHKFGSFEELKDFIISKKPPKSSIMRMDSMYKKK